VLAAGLFTLLLAATNAFAQLPVSYNFAGGVAAYLQNPYAAPPGANDWSCRPTAAHPRPVVLVHGTVFSMDLNWNALSPLLKNNGYCVFALDYGQYVPGLPVFANGPIEDSATQLATFVDKVLQATGSSQVDIVGHSQGGMLPRYYMKFDGGLAKVHTLVGLAPANHGTTTDGIGTLLDLIPGGKAFQHVVCPACYELTPNSGSSLLTNLNSGSETYSGVNYTVIMTRYDEALTPHSSGLLSGPGNIATIWVQDQCPLDFSEHVALAYDHIALQDVLNALDPAHTRRATCTPVLPFVGG
jgi:triacylglycerol esterase/lipase EstA (alpha/beta hydrolase family)